MRNLVNVRFGRWNQSDVTAACWDPETDDVLCTLGPTAATPRIELVRLREKGSMTVASWEALSPNPDTPVDEIVSLAHLSSSTTTCLLLRGRDIVTVQEDPLSDHEARIEIVGSIDAGIAAARWSPDEEILVVVTMADTVVFMGCTFDPIVEISMTSEDLKASKHVSVGWGKRETQFQGRGARALRDPTIPEKVDQGSPSVYEDGATTVTWRGDGAYVAINAVQRGSRRVVRVYSREGELDSASEPVDGLEVPLSWRPSGNLLAGIQRLPDRVDVVFFERNGLRHGQFTLRSPALSSLSLQKIRLDWNCDSTVLAVALPGLVQLWTMGNYHWYLKQEIPLPGPCPLLAWHTERALHLAAVAEEGVSILETVFRTAPGSPLPPYDSAPVAVIDGQTVNLTPFRSASIPPPMSMFELAADSCAIDIAFGRHNDSLALLHHQGVDFYDIPNEHGRFLQPKLVCKIPVPASSCGPSIPLQICAESSGRFRCISHQPKDSSPLHWSVDAESGKAEVLNSGLDLAAMSACEDQRAIEGYGQGRNGGLHRLTAIGTESLSIRFPSFLPWFEMSKQEAEVAAFGLSRNGHLFANARLLTKNCTSFAVTPSHLIFTTSNHFIKFVHLTPDIHVQALDVPADDPGKDERCRSVERGSRLVAAIPTSMSVILQMPRGNIETIFPRAMVVAGIRSLLDARDYKGAFSYCRTHRVDMNILYDHSPKHFLTDVACFLDQIRDVASIDLFLSALREEDVTQTMYRDTKRLSAKTTTEPASEAKVKVNTVCDALLAHLRPRKASNLQNIITAHVCKVPPALDSGLILVAELLQEDEKLAEKAVEHICFLVDVNRVYDHALGLYDLELALLVAQQSQRDPQEYLPFIQGLHKLPQLRRKFEIDDHLARRTKALAHLQTLDVFDELCAYAVKHALYKDALGLYRYDEPCVHTLTNLYASFLESRSAMREAGLAYESLRNYARATSCYRAAGSSCWQECLSAAQQQGPPLSAGAMTDLATSLADALSESKDYSAAATIHADYLSSLETAVRCLCKGYHFAEAVRLVVQKARPDLLASALDVGLAEALGTTTEFLADCKGQLLSQVPRIAELRRKAVEDPLAFYEGDRAGGADIPDDVSVAASSRLSTSASLFTRYTGKAGSVGTGGTGVSRATSKNRRREEKKRARGRKGTVYEEEYLVNSVRRLIERVAAATHDVERLVFALVRRAMPERAGAAEVLMADVVDACRRAVADVFAAPDARHHVGDDERAADDEPPGTAPRWRATSGGDAVLHDWMEDRSKRLEPPAVPTIGRLALLG